MKTALVHDWLTGWRGGERCLEAILPLFPDAPVYTLFHHPGSAKKEIESRPIVTSPLQRWPVPRSRYRWLLPFFPWAASRLDLDGFDLVLSISHCVAKGVIIPPGAIHVSYCLTPMRYAWDLGGEYWRGSRLPLPAAPGGALLRAWLRAWDRETSRRVTRFAAISRFVAARIRRVYGRESELIPPPVDCTRFVPDGRPESYFLIVSALQPYKRVADAVLAFRRLRLPLRIVGIGPERRRLEKLAGPETEFVGAVDEEALVKLYAGCRALVFAGVDDFGLAPVEAMACGRPVVALGRGGVLDTVIPLHGRNKKDATGVLYRGEGPGPLGEAIGRFIRNEDRFDPSVARRRALEFDLPRFQERMRSFLEAAIARRGDRC
ncbi:MAG: glycosyltransferase [Planctomycetota bacterium]|nr:glycosyltransferase [Planctomycetota bacterium]